ncbi:MAG: cell division topological specificity factor MinE [Clostridia bacterium]|nr:cell division topological specificity factor MinE [Clostridia bacterium]
MGKDIVLYENRLKNILVADKEENPMRVINVLKSDLLCILKNYMEINGDDLDISLTVDEKGMFVFNAYSKFRRLKNLGAIRN